MYPEYVPALIFKAAFSKVFPITRPSTERLPVTRSPDCCSRWTTIFIFRTCAFPFLNSDLGFRDEEEVTHLVPSTLDRFELRLLGDVLLRCLTFDLFTNAGVKLWACENVVIALEHIKECPREHRVA